MPTQLDLLTTTIRHSNQNRLYGSWSFHSWVSSKSRYMCMAIPKVACTTLKSALYGVDNGTSPEPGTVHWQGHRLWDYTTEEIAEVLMSPEWFRFSFVRNPYGRLLSAYKSKVVSPQDRRYRWLAREAAQYIGKDTGSVVTFKDFVTYLAVCRNPRVTDDGHLASQSILMMLELTSYDFIGRFEHLGRDLRIVLERLSAPEAAFEAANQITNSTTDVGPSLSEAYDEATAQLVYGMYRDDFEILEYPKDSWLGS